MHHFTSVGNQYLSLNGFCWQDRRIQAGGIVMNRPEQGHLHLTRCNTHTCIHIFTFLIKGKIKQQIKTTN